MSIPEQLASSGLRARAQIIDTQHLQYLVEVEQEISSGDILMDRSRCPQLKRYYGMISKRAGLSAHNKHEFYITKIASSDVTVEQLPPLPVL